MLKVINPVISMIIILVVNSETVTQKIGMEKHSNYIGGDIASIIFGANIKENTHRNM